MSPPHLVLRPFAATDDDALIGWVRSAEELLLFAGPDLKWPLDTAQLAAIRANSQTNAWTAVISPADRPVGHVELVIIGRRRGHIARVIIDPARRGEGLGRLLVLAALEQARGRGADLVTLNVRSGNDIAIGIYSALGFRDDGVKPSDPEVLKMALRL